MGGWCLNGVCAWRFSVRVPQHQHAGLPACLGTQPPPQPAACVPASLHACSKVVEDGRQATPRPSHTASLSPTPPTLTTFSSSFLRATNFSCLTSRYTHQASHASASTDRRLSPLVLIARLRGCAASGAAQGLSEEAALAETPRRQFSLSRTPSATRRVRVRESFVGERHVLKGWIQESTAPVPSLSARVSVCVAADDRLCHRHPLCHLRRCLQWPPCRAPSHCGMGKRLAPSMVAVWPYPL